MIQSAVMMTDTHWGQLRRIPEHNDLTFFFYKPIGLLKAFSLRSLYSFHQVRASGLNIPDSLAQVVWRETQAIKEPGGYVWVMW